MAAPSQRPAAGAPRRQGGRLRLGPVFGLLMGLIVLLAPAGAWADAGRPQRQDCAPIDTAGVAALFDRWNAALASGDPEQVAALYSDDALLLPTLSPVPRSDHAAIADYFVQFLAQAPEGRIDSRTVRLGCNEALDAGTYSFLLHPAGQEPRRVAARYSFVYAFDGSHWRIQHHHSSLMPS